MTFKSPVFSSEFISFTSNEVKPIEENTFIAYGELMANDMTYPASFEFQVRDFIKGLVSFKE